MELSTYDNMISVMKKKSILRQNNKQYYSDGKNGKMA